MDNPPSTVPHELLVTLSRPDIVFVGDDKTIIIVEPMIPFNSPDALASARSRKTSKYQLLLSDLKGKGFRPHLLTYGSWSLAIQDSR